MSEREVITKEMMLKDPLVADRAKYLGPTYTHFYKKPLHLVKGILFTTAMISRLGQGIWVWDHEGTRLLDFYNNVPHVGHCHPTVLKALTEQASKLNTHTRYLHENIVNLGMPTTLDGV
jgi:4-aminobutyrate aminotransferase-like enzyme